MPNNDNNDDNSLFVLTCKHDSFSSSSSELMNVLSSGTMDGRYDTISCPD